MNGRELHFIAIGGAGMSGLALVCHQLGARVSGSDRARSSYFDRVAAGGIDARIGHDAELVPPGADVVVSTAVPDDNPELVRARVRGQRVIHRGALLAELCALGRLIAVAGTHGKTTTAGMLVHALRALGAQPGFFLGGELPGVADDGGPANAGWGGGDWIVAEADESDASFLELEPEIAVVTNVELDHHARWQSVAELREAFRRFAARANGLALGAGPDLDAVVPEGTARSDGRVVRFDGDRPGPSLTLAVPGHHNLLNARAALAALELAGFDLEAAGAALADFPGMLRRQERKGRTASGAEVYDDYAHHPTEVAATLAALRELSARRLVAIFQPHLYSRTKALADRFGLALAEADAVGVLDVYAAREEPVGELTGVSGLAVAQAAAEHAAGKPVWWLRDAETAAKVLPAKLRAGDLVVTVGAGDVFELANRLVEDGG